MVSALYPGESTDKKSAGRLCLAHPSISDCLIIDFSTLESDMLSVAFHCQLLKVCRESFKVLFIGQDGNSFSSKKVSIPDTEKCPLLQADLIQTVQCGNAHPSGESH